MPTVYKQHKSLKLDYTPIIDENLNQIGIPTRFDRSMNTKTLTDAAPHILVVDDDDRIRTLLQRYLSDRGLRVTAAADAETARRFIETLAFELLVVDVMMPGEDGLSLTTSIRETSDVPILMLTARSDTKDRIHGLETGADDYLTKPFEPRELLLRINNILRRSGPPSEAKIELVKFGPFTFNLDRGELREGEQIIKLTDREKEMMRIFCSAAGECVPRHALLSDPTGAGERTVDVQINRLRRKIETDPTNPIFLQTVRGIGYRILPN